MKKKSIGEEYKLLGKFVMNNESKLVIILTTSSNRVAKLLKQFQRPCSDADDPGLLLNLIKY